MFTVGAETASFQRNMKAAADSVKGIQDAIGVINLDAFVNLGQKAMAGAEQVINFTRSIASGALEIERNARTLDMSIEDYQKWTYAVKMGGGEVDDFINSFRFFTTAIGQAEKGTGNGALAFNALGVSLKNANGQMKDEQTLFLEVVDKLNKFADGTNRNIIMNDLFSRSYIKIKPILNEGSEAIRGYMDEASRMGTVLGDVVVKAGSDAERQFKTMEAQINATKLSMAPFALEFSKVVGSVVDDLRKFFTMEPPTWVKILWGLTPMGQPTFLMDLWDKLGKKIGVVPSPSETSKFAATAGLEGWEVGGAMFAGPKPEAPAIVDPDNPFGIKGFSLRRVTEELNKLKAQAASTAPSAVGWGDEETTGVKKGEMAINGMIITIKDYETSLKALDEAYLKGIDIQEIAGPTQEQTNAITARSIALENERKQSILDLTKQYGELTDNLQLVIATDKASEDEYIRINNLTDQQISLIRLLGNERRLQLANREIVDEVTDVARSMSSAWSSNLLDMFKGTQSFADGMKKIFSGMGDIIIKKLLEISANYLLMGNITGNKITGGAFGGIGNLLSGLFGGGGGGGGTIAAAGSFETGFEFLQHGGIVQRPTLAMVGESGPEAVIPLRGGKVPIQGGGDTYTNILIEATDVDSFMRRYGPAIENVVIRGKRFNKMGFK
jgi:hypothetical protein